MFISVDLPAPFSPSRQWIWPGSTVRSILSLAVNVPKRSGQPSDLEFHAASSLMWLLLIPRTWCVG